MVKRMLIDATHPEETRVVVVNGTRLEELDVETSTKRQLKGNIYLAKVVRVEPSLQAAFVEYGGNRHGFLAFSEIHPDYFQIPVADRQALLAAQRAEVMREATNDRDDAEPVGEGHLAAEAVAEAADGATVEDAPAQQETPEAEGGEAEPRKRSVETVGGDDDADNERRRAKLLRHYKIQEVVKRRQIMLIQVVKEERGNKGAALTTYLSLAGRYCVLMPNTARGGGVSRKIVNSTDRRRLKAIANEMDIPDGMAVIIRTAGSERSKTEIRRDYEYLLRMWDSVRDLTLKSSAPELVYEEASLIKRSIRDLYARDIDEVLVDGDEGYRLAKDYMRMLTPSHAKKVQPYKDPVMPMFHRYQVETQLDAMHSPTVQLKSGGYIVISQTEALVAIDVNSGRATKERHIEETALKTNMEAADEVARQLRLRDLAGLIVIDFIDMEENRNNNAVERRIKEALKNDRARIQVGKISAFGLLELSRQRLRPSLQETTFSPCPHCAGTGLVRSVESAAVHVLRAIEEEGIRRRSSEVTVYVSSAIALYILNQKRSALAAIEERYEFTVLLLGDDTLIPPNYRMDRVKAEFRDEPVRTAISMDDAAHRPPPAVEETDDADAEEEDEAEEAPAGRAAEGGRPESECETDAAGRKRRRRRRKKRRPEDGQPGEGSEEGANERSASANDAEGESEDDAEGDEDGEGEEGDEPRADEAEGADGDQPRKRRRGRRGGRRRRRRDGPDGVEGAEGQDGVEGTEAPEGTDEPQGNEDDAPIAAVAEVDADAPVIVEPAAEEKPKRKRAAPRKKAAAEAPTEEAVTAEPAAEEKPKRKRAAPRKKAEAAPEAEAPVAEPAPTPEPEPVAAEPPPEPPAPAPVVEAPAPAPVAAEPEQPLPPANPPRKGWWNRLIS
ncbi:ribonuclease E/G [Paramagnetospirillum kuznetsovii]|uniref:Ribonuclease E n=1 Tax=Paramagnetospirillum kuznetsovii TaxID=2053833 RepID=A0A364NWC6_9PROT|nr:ribonuclease E/G [Paramagnetospirillum kuznetsovii]RAU21353.1 ribonuclease E/G [Paramagnetospirillum kuznetsovii]